MVGKRYAVVSSFAVLFSSYPAYARTVQEEVVSRIAGRHRDSANGGEAGAETEAVPWKPLE